jgi:HlyD family secretion protein
VIKSKKRAILWSILGVSLVGIAVAAAAQGISTQQPTTGRSDDQNWLAVAPGLVEPQSGQIKITAAAIGPIGRVLVHTNDKVLAGQLLVGLDDQDAVARVETSRAQVAMQKRQRNDQAAGKAADRRKAEDALADAEAAVVTARDAFDDAAIAIYGGHGSTADLTKAHTELTSAEDALSQKRAALRKLESQSGTPLPTENEGQLNVARSNLWAAEVGLEKLKIRAPIDGTVLQVNARLGELAAPSSPDPLVLLGDLSALRVRAELDERDIAEVKLGQQVVVRADAFPGRDFHGKVASIAPIVQAGRINSPNSRNLTDFDVTQVQIDLTDPGPLLVGMKVDVYFERPAPAKPAAAKPAAPKPSAAASPPKSTAAATPPKPAQPATAAK